ncbi:Uncharacterized protein OnM2_048039 [Erysiphe neolycopersici]|uniref:C2 NT-type domain-containing protein n=1 Tax=Erysiphe neolycopersici TaxID=212602 RepID=A0A420HTD4_9PEZI|nr:Uncharacterized protein OnM2_048039 [Erysiphe neolycopersici]
MGKYEVHSSATLAMNPLISKARKASLKTPDSMRITPSELWTNQFCSQNLNSLSMYIYDLINVPLVTGTSFVKWHLPTSTAAEHRGRTDRASIKEHKVVWKYKRIIPLRLVINRHNKLQDCMIHFDVVQDCSTPDRSDKITLGKIELNLAEYVNEVEIGLDGEGSVVRRYLMQDSKINSTLKVGIGMKQIDGDRNFFARPLKTVNMFGGITGIMEGDQEGKDDNGHVPTSMRSRDQGEMQDVYRQILAASWKSNDGQPPADKCINDIFNGGDGWNHNDSYKSKQYKPYEDEARQIHTNNRRNRSNMSQKPNDDRLRPVPYSIPHKYGMGLEISRIDGDTQRESTKVNSEASEVRCYTSDEIDENNVRDNMIAWKTWRSPDT